MGKFGAGIVAGAIFGLGIAMLDKRTVKKAKKMMRSVGCCM